ALAGDDGGVQRGHNACGGQQQRKQHQRAVRRNQPQHPPHRGGAEDFVLFAHSVFSTSSRESWLRQISLYTGQLSSSAACSPQPTSAPSSRTRISSARCTAAARCETMTTVMPSV